MPKRDGVPGIRGFRAGHRPNQLGGNGVTQTLATTEARESRNRVIGADDLASALRAHARWIESGGTEGARADLSRADLTRANLDRAMLQSAVLRGTRLKGASLRRANLLDSDLTGANLHGADLTGADLRRCQLREATLRESTLVDADLSGAHGLLSGQLGGANLAAANLPDEISKFEGLANVAEASKTTQNLFFSILFVCSYTWLTIASTRDVQLLNNAAPASSRLPILGTDIPLVQFYLVAPLLLLCLFIYFHLCLQRLWEELSELPAVFPDGRAVDKKAYPWLFNVLVRTHAPRLRDQRSHLARVQTQMSIILAWGIVPLTIALLWARFLRAHDWLVTGAHILILSASIGVGIGFRRLAVSTLRGSERRPFQWHRSWQDARARSVAASVAAMILLVTISYGAIEGTNPDSEDRGVLIPARTWVQSLDPREWIPRGLKLLGVSPFAHLDDTALSTKPANWSGGESPAEIDAVRGGDLERRDLRYALAYNTFGVSSYLKYADARGSDLRFSDLRYADFRYARLERVNFRYAKLRKTDFGEADLTDAKLKDADLTDAKFPSATLVRASLVRAILKGADLSDANLQGADLTDAELDGANLTGANLTDVTGFTEKQLGSAKIDARTRLPTKFHEPTIETAAPSA
jgi:uncharacterized protein YjbI with pentapeptide repeats